MSFEKAIAQTLKYEGGYVNHPNDPGGETNFGISKRAYPQLDIRKLTRAMAEAIYRRDYWDANQCGTLPEPLDLLHFDACVNHGAQRANAFLDISDNDPVAYLDAREQFFRAIVAKDPKKGVFLKGWLNRVADLRKLVA